MELRTDSRAADTLGRPESSSSGEDTSTLGLSIRHVLVPLDGSPLAECVLPFVAAVARPFAARLTLLRVLDSDHRAVQERHIDPLEWEICQAAVRNELNRTAAEFASFGVSANVHISCGCAEEQIIQFAKKERVDLIALASHGEGGVSPWLLSGTVHKVVLRSPTSVFVVPAYAHPKSGIGALRLTRILVPLDCSLRAECVLPLASVLARAYDGEVILAHVVKEPELPRRTSPSTADINLAAQLVQRNRSEAEHYLAALQHDVMAQGTRARVQIVVSSHCERTLRELANEENVDLILFSAHGKTADATERYGGLATRLMQSGSKPMIIVQDLAAVLRAVTPAEDAVGEHAGH